MDHAHLVLALLTLGDPRRLSGGYLYHLRMAEAAPRHAATVTFVSFPERRFPLGALDAPRLLGRARALGAHALVLDSIVAALVAPSLALRSPPVAVVGSLHQPPGGIDHPAARRVAQAALDRVAYRRARVLIAASEALARELAGAGLDGGRIVVVPPGRDVAAAPAAPAWDLRRGRGAALLCVANWLPRKGIVELLDAFAGLPEQAATLHLAGDEGADPRYAAVVRARLSEPGLAARVVRHGAVSRDAVAALYAGADAFVLPALREPYGTVLGEAMAFGLPVAGWRAGNLPHLATDGEEGLIVAPGDVRALRAALARLADDEALRRRLGDAGRRRAMTRPTWEQSAAMFFGAIRAALDPPARPDHRRGDAGPQT